jgi:hypothetical protein
MTLRAGKIYKTRNGLITSPIQKKLNGTSYVFTAEVQEPEFPDKSVRNWLETGEFLCPQREHRLDLVEEVAG